MSSESPLKRKVNHDLEDDQQQDQQQQQRDQQDHDELQSSAKRNVKRRNPVTVTKRCELNNNQEQPPVVQPIDDQIKSEMIANYQPWVVKTYGDLAKTKTVTLKKYARILRTLQGDEVISADNSKFRFWVKAKGFHIGQPDNYDAKPADAIIGRFSVCDIDDAIEPDAKSAFGSAKDPPLYVPNTQMKNSINCENNNVVYRKVAVVENFFDIIYSVHVELEGRPGKHAGQKRTYRTITETYAFLPREAVTRFLLSCTLCQRRPRSPSPVLPTSNRSAALTSIKSIFSPYNMTNKAASLNSDSSKPKLWSPAESINSSSDSPKLSIDYSLPITSTYLRYMRNFGCSDEDALKLEKLENLSSSEVNENIDEDQQSQQQQQQHQHQQQSQHFNTNVTGPPLSAMGTNNQNLNAIKESDKLKLMLLAWNYHNQQAQGIRNGGAEMNDLNSLIQQQQQLQQSLNGEDMANLWANYHTALKGKGTPPNMPRDQSPAPGTDAGSVQDETSSSGNKEDDEDDDDESDDRIDIQQYDPDRLKAFNMFVRLFVDENLDRMVPISKQPKEKIQAIIDSCTRQFPEFSERARKRIRTYLKSCRRNKRSRDSGPTWDTARPTPAHLTSVQAEQLLASACENESHNAKRMRLGLEPVSQPMPVLSGSNIATDSVPNISANRGMELPSGLIAKQETNSNTNSDCISSQFPSNNSLATSVSTSKGLQNLQEVKNSNSSAMAPSTAAASLAAATNPLNGFGVATTTTSSTTNTGLYRPNFPQSFPRNSNQYQLFPMQQFPGTALLNGPTDLSMKHNKPILSHKLNTGEIAAVRQLITGYRESAAFLIRSADELEQLLQQQ